MVVCKQSPQHHNYNLSWRVKNSLILLAIGLLFAKIIVGILKTEEMICRSFKEQ